MGLLADEGRIPPVWERLPAIFRYPFHGTCLVTLGVYAILYFLGMVFPLLLGLILTIAAYAGLYKFSADVLEATAHGWMEPPEIQSTGSSMMLVKQFAIAVVMYGLVFLTGFLTGSAFLAITVAVICLLAWPASIMLVVMTNSLINALNPLSWFDVISRMGKAYFIAAALLGLLALSQGMAEQFLVGLTGFGMLAGVGTFLIAGYFMIASFHLMGYLIFEKHEELGIEVKGEGPSSGDETEAASPLLGEVASLLREGETDTAIARLRQSLKQGGLLEEHDHYRKLLQLQGRNRELLEHARDYLPILLYGHEQAKKAMQLVQECLRMDPRFKPGQAKEIRDLARVLDRFEDYESVIRLTNGFARAHPRHPDVAENYYLAARAFWFGRGQKEQALGILKQLLRRYPDHPLKAEMARLATRLESGPDASASPA